ncbi:MAG: low molecular weight protein-tyrosine-phosphatase [Ardenticatenia bacterium]|nr:low molecular weight protein-tyrosine-phosphatase [Ardenticatenia bacterium]
MMVDELRPTGRRPVRVLFICAGNICRSPMAEAVFRHKVEQAGLGHHVEVDSAGVGAWNVGEPPHRSTIRELRRRGVPVPQRRARQITPEDLERFDYLIVMDLNNLNMVRTMARHQGVPKEPRLLLEFLEDERAPVEVPDPFYTHTYSDVFNLVDRATDGLLEAIRRRHGF